MGNNISKIQLQDNIYAVKDITARDSIEALKQDLDSPLDLSSYSKGDVIPTTIIQKIQTHRAHLRVLYDNRYYNIAQDINTPQLVGYVFISLDASGDADAVQTLVIAKFADSSDYKLADVGSVDVASYIDGILTIKLSALGKFALTDGTYTMEIGKNNALSSGIAFTLPATGGTFALLSDTTVTSQKVTDALGYTPYDATNPEGYISGITSTDVTTAHSHKQKDRCISCGYTFDSSVAQ